MGPGSDWSTALRDRDLEGHQGARPKVRFPGGEHIGKFSERITHLLRPGGPSQSHVSKTQSPAGGATVGPRRARTKNAGLGSVVPAAPARAASPSIIGRPARRYSVFPPCHLTVTRLPVYPVWIIRSPVTQWTNADYST